MIYALFVNDKQLKHLDCDGMTAHLKKYYRLTVEEIESLFASWELSIDAVGMVINFELVPVSVPVP